MRNGYPHIHSAVHSAMRRHFLKSLGLLFDFMRKSSKFIPYLSAADARTGAGASSGASGAADANHSWRRIILLVVVFKRSEGNQKGRGEDCRRPSQQLGDARGTQQCAPSQ